MGCDIYYIALPERPDISLAGLEREVSCLFAAGKMPKDVEDIDIEHAFFSIVKRGRIIGVFDSADPRSQLSLDLPRPDWMGPIDDDYFTELANAISNMGDEMDRQCARLDLLKPFMQFKRRGCYFISMSW